MAEFPAYFVILYQVTYLFCQHFYISVFYQQAILTVVNKYAGKWDNKPELTWNVSR